MNTELKKFDELSAAITEFVAPTKNVVVTDAESSSLASKTFRELNDWEKKVEAKRKELVGPLNAEVDRINEYAKMLKVPVLEAKAHVSEELKKHERKLEVERQEALRLQRVERERQELEAQRAIEKQRAETEAKIKELKDEAEALAMFTQEDEAEIAMIKAEEEAQKAKAAHDAEAARIAFEVKQNHWDAKKEIAQNKVSGTRRVWSFKLLDISKVPAELKITSLDEKKVKQLIALGQREIAGIEIFQELSITAR